MKKATFKLLLCLLVVLMLPCIAFAADAAPENGFFNTFWALVPPIIAIGLALITKEVYSSLFIGIVCGVLLYTNFDVIGTITGILCISDADGNAVGGIIGSIANTGMMGIFIFLILLGIIVALINKAGGSAAFGRWAKVHIKSRAGAAIATFILGVLIFVDDYFNCLTVGSVMRPITDTHKISRAKLAYLIDATAAPVCMIAPISSWAAAVSEFAPEGQGLSLFIQAIPYNFYSLLTLLFVVLLVVLKLDYGPMKKFEKNAMNGDLFTIAVSDVTNEEAQANPKGRVIDLVLPVVVLVVSCVIGMLYVGGLWDGASIVDAFANTDATSALPLGGMISLLVIIIYMLCRRLTSFKGAMDCIVKGFIAMVPALIILTMATTLKDITNLMGADAYVAGVMDGAAAGLQAFLPAIIFLVACFLSFSTGTSWGTFGILIPIVVNVFPAGSEMLIIGMSACLAGAVCGDHCSPISDTTIMSSAGAQCDHVSHVSTQLPYAITVAAISFVSFIIAGFVQNVFIALPAGIIITVATMLVIKKVTAKA